MLTKSLAAVREVLLICPVCPLFKVTVFCPPPTAVFLNGARVAPGQVAPGYTAERGRVQLRFADGGNGLAAEIDPAP